MGWGIWKKIKQGIGKAVNWVKNKIVKPVGRFVGKVAKPLLSVAVKAAPAVATAIGASKGQPQIGAMVGQTIQNVGQAFGLG